MKLLDSSVRPQTKEDTIPLIEGQGQPKVFRNEAFLLRLVSAVEMEISKD